MKCVRVVPVIGSQCGLSHVNSELHGREATQALCCSGVSLMFAAHTSCLPSRLL